MYSMNSLDFKFDFPHYSVEKQACLPINCHKDSKAQEIG